MKFVCYSNWDQLPKGADTLFAQCEKQSLFYSRPWFENLITTLVDEVMLLACVVVDNKVLALLPLIQSTKNNFLSFKHRYTTHYSLLLTEDNQAQIIDCLVQGLTQRPVRSLLLEPVANDDAAINRLRTRLEQSGFQCAEYFRFYNWIYRVQGQSFADYMAARPARLRNTIARKQRKLEREHGYDIRLYSGEDVPPAMADYYAAYTASWKANEQYVGFLDGIVTNLSCPGWSRLGVLYVRDQPIAAQLWFVAHGKASIFRLAYDEAWKPYSPGSILTSYLMEYVIDTDRVEEIDFLTGNDAYKQDWMSDRRERYALSCVKNGAAQSWLEKFSRSLKNLLPK